MIIPPYLVREKGLIFVSNASYAKTSLKERLNDSILFNKVHPSLVGTPFPQKGLVRFFNDSANLGRDLVKG